MRGGQNRKPTSVKKAQGTFRPSRDNKKAPDPPLAAVGDPPEGCPKAQVRAWRLLAPQVEFTFAESDRAAFTLLTGLYAKLEDPKIAGSPSAYARIVQSVSSLLQQFGCTPATRGRVAQIRGGLPTEKDQTEAFLFKPTLVVSKKE